MTILWKLADGYIRLLNRLFAPCKEHEWVCVDSYGVIELSLINGVLNYNETKYICQECGKRHYSRMTLP